MTHTPGPWKNDAGAGIVATMERETLKSGRVVARRVACAKGLTIDEVRANARLIAAAPKLAAALQDALGMLDHYISGRPDNWDGSTAGQTRSTIRDGRAALAKAGVK